MKSVNYIPARGDIVWIALGPHKGREQGFRRPVIILSPLSYNQKTSLAVLCPITNQVKGYAFEVTLPEGMKTTGVVIADHIKNLDWRARETVFIEKAPDELIDEVLAKIDALIF
ncbi:type II toxin-antitoxin system PemK/MazF family toxin [Chroococcidiopsis sp.]|uniref:type II toxin-antitoxin system PemK/MazF family toxin n=1 Tax=Chroococcidiopsis sp. TaxID=3088168 RepID=UPI003F2B7E96